MEDLRLWLVRHGETEWSRDDKHTSTTDIGLTEAGTDAAKALRERLGREEFTHVFTSPMSRARTTAELCGFDDALTDDRLVEWSYGEYEGMTRDQVRERDPDWTVWNGTTPGGETADQVAARLTDFVAYVNDLPEVRNADQAEVLVFGHGHSLRALGAVWVGAPVSFGQNLLLQTATISVLGIDRGTPVIVRWNDEGD